jgi:hypothetical protein
MSPRIATIDEMFIRPATQDDVAALVRLAELDSAAPLRGDVLMAIVGEQPWAAISLLDGRAVADPFVASASAVELLRMRARHLGAGRLPGRSAPRRLLGLGRAAA